MEDYTLLGDEALFARFRFTADEAMFLEIYQRYHAKLYSAAAKRCNSPEAAEELVQDLFVKLWKNRQQISLHTTLSGYLFTSIRNSVLNYLHQEALRKHIRVNCEIQDIYADNSTEETLLSSDLSAHIERQVKNLPERCRSVFELSRFHHKTNKQIAQEMGITEKTVENQITRAIKFLRIGLQHLFIFIVLLSNSHRF